MKDRILGHVPVISRATPVAASAERGGVRLDFAEPGGASNSIVVDHIVAATGFRVDMERLEFLDRSVRSALRTVDGAPVLSAHFETSLAGLYVIGPSAAFSFGPVMRFVYGARFTTPRIFQHLLRKAAGSARGKGAPVASELAAVH
jgi:hypothetical protein